jgi:hypothetical protein
MAVRIEEKFCSVTIILAWSTGLGTTVLAMQYSKAFIGPLNQHPARAKRLWLQCGKILERRAPPPA